MMKKLHIPKEDIKKEIRQNKASFVVYVMLRTLVILMMILQILNKNYENAFLCVLTLILFIVPSFTQVVFKIELPSKKRKAPEGFPEG